jgi:ATP-binding protein involved in chromosome partitioning
VAAPNPFDQQRPIDGVARIIAVGSGKGGVGKSTISANLALSLAKQGRKVGLLDADIYGPSQPRLFGLINQRPKVSAEQRIEPLERYGIKIMSMGFLVDEGAAVVWRGPMLFKAMDQFFRDVDWGTLDDLIIDLPPGTGDVQLSVAQKVPLAGAIIVCTPQNVALADVKKSIDMFKRVGTPVLGLIENMSYFVDGDGNKHSMFPKGELNSYLDKERIPKLGELPFDPKLAQACEIGIPFVQSATENPSTKVFERIAEDLAQKETR